MKVGLLVHAIRNPLDISAAAALGVDAYVACLALREKAFEPIEPPSIPTAHRPTTEEIEALLNI